MAVEDTVAFPSFPPLPDPDEKYRTIVADPPWQYDDTLPGGGRSAESHYDTLHEGMVAGMGPQVNHVADTHAHLWLWTTNFFLEHAYDIVRDWGFTPKTLLTWVKGCDAPESLPFEREESAEVNDYLGMGRYLRNSTEHVVFATKGNYSVNRSDVPTHFFAEVGDHSAKPEKFYRLVEAVSDGPRLELFSRQARDGWEVWGDEV